MNKLFFIILFLFGVFKVNAGDTDTTSYARLNKVYFKSYWTDSKNLVISPCKWQKKQWFELGIVVGTGILAYSQDENIQSYFIRHQYATAGNFSKYVFEPFGNGKGTSVLLGCLFLGGKLAKNNRLAGTSLTAAKALVISTVCVQVAKQMPHRQRPFQGNVPDHTGWNGPFKNIQYNSFPSGHSTAAFSVATVFAMEYRSTVWIPALAYTLAAGTAISRLYDNKHWASDVLAGSALGFVTGRFIWKQSQKNNRKIVLLPSVSVQSASLDVIIRL